MDELVKITLDTILLLQTGVGIVCNLWAWLGKKNFLYHRTDNVCSDIIYISTNGMISNVQQ